MVNVASPSFDACHFFIVFFVDDKFYAYISPYKIRARIGLPNVSIYKNNVSWLKVKENVYQNEIISNKGISWKTFLSYGSLNSF